MRAIFILLIILSSFTSLLAIKIINTIPIDENQFDLIHPNYYYSTKRNLNILGTYEGEFVMDHFRNFKDKPIEIFFNLKTWFKKTIKEVEIKFTAGPADGSKSLYSAKAPLVWTDGSTFGTKYRFRYLLDGTKVNVKDWPIELYAMFLIEDMGMLGVFHYMDPIVKIKGWKSSYIETLDTNGQPEEFLTIPLVLSNNLPDGKYIVTCNMYDANTKPVFYTKSPDYLFKNTREGEPVFRLRFIKSVIGDIKDFTIRSFRSSSKMDLLFTMGTVKLMSFDLIS